MTTIATQTKHDEKGKPAQVDLGIQAAEITQGEKGTQMEATLEDLEEAMRR